MGTESLFGDNKMTLSEWKDRLIMLLKDQRPKDKTRYDFLNTTVDILIARHYIRKIESRILGR